jgi:acyl-CoA reductase-like NAD-dependent aldehyde dehydrogenase
MWKRVPLGPCSFITPFNFPLNLVAHKIAPAIAAGCPFVLKPASLTPIGALQIGAILAECELPEGSLSILPCSRDGAALFTEDERLKLLSFTGSDEVGWKLKAKAGKKRVVLELGGNAASVVCADWDLEDAIERNVVGAFYQSGQSCISVQRLYVEAERYEAFKRRFCERARELRSGDPEDRDTTVGPMISESEAERLEGWIREAVEGGARILCGGERDGALLSATVLEGVPKGSQLWNREAFGPVALLEPFDDYDAVLDAVNDSTFGLQAGVFTDSIARMNAAWDRLEVGGVMIGDVPSWRIDPMPYGGVKDSGLGREGARFAIEDMTELRLLVVRERS